jgi:hypothetical protein
LAPTEESTGRPGSKSIVFSSDDEILEYYREALFEAVTYCMTKGLAEDYVASLDVIGFGELYKYLKRIDARDRIARIGDLRTAQGAGKKDYCEYLSAIEVWLPKQEIGLSSNKGRKHKKEFDNMCKQGF